MSPRPAPNFPNDPLLRLLPSERPPSFDEADEKTQGWRGRVFLMTWALGGSVAISWDMAMRDEPVHNAELQDTVRRSDDEVIRQAVSARRLADRAASRIGLT